MGHAFELRKKYILGKIDQESSVLVKDIADELGVSETTIRRDLNELDSRKLIRQVYGGAVRIERSSRSFRFAWANRSTQEIEAKKRIGRRAASFVQDDDILYIDPGTTSWEMIPYLKEKRNLTIISNSVRLQQCMEFIGHHNIIQLGGTFRPDRLDTVGTLAILGLEQLRGYKAFQGGDGMDIEFGLSAIDHESALIAKTALDKARQVFVIADHTKFESPSMLFKIADIDNIDYIITDRPLSSQWNQTCERSNINVIFAEG
ncbi:MAG: DeoR family transcriptional regulator [Chitinivibrionales bacterium]|nr:DeoR family transcriptional regulator [Chitinivibrionales bacterium]MBD3395582.1 DeoR family transcriptional regulator [Chitinivibrionales bacterium]